MIFTREQIKNVLAGHHVYNENVIDLLERLKSHDDRTFLKSINTMKVVAKIIETYSSVQEEEKEEVLIGAVLHDIGYLSIKKETINPKKGITAHEYNEIKLHPIYGLDVISKYPELDKKQIKDIVLCHHEITDGSGYPRGITEISQYAQLVGAVSAFRAMSYESRKKHLPPYQALITLAYEGVSQKIINNIQFVYNEKKENKVIPYVNKMSLCGTN